MATHIVAEQDAATRVTLSIVAELWDGFAEVGRIEVDIARHLDQRVSITVVELDRSRTGPVEISLR